MKKIGLEIKWALIFAGATLLWMLIEKLMGWHGANIEMHPVMTNIFAIVAIGVYVLAIRDKRNKLGGVISWKEGMISGALITVFVAILSPLTQYIVHHVISPDFFANAIDFAVQSGQATQSDAEAYFNFGNYVKVSTIGALVMGLLTSAIVSFVLKKTP